MFARPVGATLSMFHRTLPVPAGTGKAVWQGRMEEGFLLSQNSKNAGIKVPVWRLLLLPKDQPGPLIHVRYLFNSGEVCSCGKRAVGSCGIYKGDSFINISDKCEGCLEEVLSEDSQAVKRE